MQRKSWLSKYFFSYLILGLLPVLVGFVFYYTNTNAVKREIKNSNFAALVQALGDLDHISTEMRNIAFHFSGYLENFESLKKLSCPVGELPRRDRDLLSQRIKAYEEALDFPASVFFYIRADSRLYTAEGVLPYGEFEAAVRQEGDLTMSGFFSLINRLSNTASLKLSPYFFADKGFAPNVVYLFPLPYLDIRPQAILCFMVRNEDVKNVFENYLGETGGGIYVFDKDYRNLYSLGRAVSADSVKKLGNLKGVGVQDRKTEGRNHILMRAVSEYSGTSCVALIWEGEFFSRIRPMRIMLLSSVAVLGIAGCAAAFFLARRNYRPIRRLISNMGGSSWENEKKEGSEFDFIMDKWNAIEETNLELNHELDRQRPMVVDSCLRSLLKGEYGNREELDYYLKCAHLSLAEPLLFVLIAAPSGEGCGALSLSSRIQGILSGIDRVVSQNCRLYGIELILEQQVAIIGGASSLEGGGKDIRVAIAEFLAKDMAEKEGFDVKISAGKVVDSPFGINASFLEAKVVMSDYLGGGLRIMTFEEAHEKEEAQEDREYQYPVIEQAMYLQSLKQGNRESALKAVDEMIGKIAQVEAFPITQCLCFDLVNMMIKISGQLGSRIKIADIKALSGLSDMNAFRLKARELTEGLCEKYAEIQEQKSSRLKTEIINHVNSHFHERQFGMQQLADAFSVSPNYLSRFFRQETGHTFIDYVSILRMDRVKHLLASTDKRIKDIVIEVGYLDAPSFLRKFKAAEGITPGQYRERVRQSGAQ
ncbi:MAG: AraC family transcriptional regulator [Treponema sp.]|jgi:AraC-like DNA-binding protein|nr:AraC family transcriptional regulator [Treponema sp.]